MKAETVDKLNELKADMDRRLSEMKNGASFFVPDAIPSDFGFLRSAGYRLGIRLSIRWVLQDPIYGKKGTRIYRTGER